MAGGSLHAARPSQIIGGIGSASGLGWPQQRQRSSARPSREFFPRPLPADGAGAGNPALSESWADDGRNVPTPAYQHDDCAQSHPEIDGKTECPQQGRGCDIRTSVPSGIDESGPRVRPPPQAPFIRCAGGCAVAQMTLDFDPMQLSSKTVPPRLVIDADASLTMSGLCPIMIKRQPVRIDCLYFKPCR